MFRLGKIALAGFGFVASAGETVIRLLLVRFPLPIESPAPSIKFVLLCSLVHFACNGLTRSMAPLSIYFQCSHLIHLVASLGWARRFLFELKSLTLCTLVASVRSASLRGCFALGCSSWWCPSLGLTLGSGGLNEPILISTRHSMYLGLQVDAHVRAASRTAY